MDHADANSPTQVTTDPMTPIPATSSSLDAGQIDPVESSPDTAHATPVTHVVEAPAHPIPAEFNITQPMHHGVPDHATKV